MSKAVNGTQVIGSMILFVVVFGLLRGCSDPEYQGRYNYCMHGSSGRLSVFKALFCIWE